MFATTLAGSGQAQAPPVAPLDPSGAPAAVPGRTASATRVFAVADTLLASELRANPTQRVAGAPFDRLPDRSHAARTVLERARARAASVLAEIDPGALEGTDAWALHAALSELLAAKRDLGVCRLEEWDVGSNLTGWFDDLAGPGNGGSIAWRAPAGTPETRRGTLALWRSLPAAVDVELVNLRAGLAGGRAAHRRGVLEVIDRLDTLLVQPVDRTPFLLPARRDTADGAASAAFHHALAGLVADTVRPALARYRDFLRAEYLPRARSDEALAALPDGMRCYRAYVRASTTLDLPPEELRARLARVHALYEGAAREVLRERLGREDDPYTWLREHRRPGSPTLPTRDSVLAWARALTGRAVAAAPRAFAVVPAPPTVSLDAPADEGRGVAGHMAESPAYGSVPPGLFVNGAIMVLPGQALNEALVFHEGWPGHALQYQHVAERRLGTRPHPIADMLPADGYLEGWATYAAFRVAGGDLGLFGSDAAYAYEAAQLAFGARRAPLEVALHEGTLAGDSAVAAYVRAGQNPATVQGAIRRFYDWPGQGHSYRLGAEVFFRLRRDAERALGACFDVKRFHAAVLDDGPLPLPALELKLGSWTTSERRRVVGTTCAAASPSGAEP